MIDANEIEAVFDFITYNVTLALHLEDYDMEPGCRANLNVLEASTVREALRLQQPPEWVICQGKVLAHNQLQRKLVKR